MPSDSLLEAALAAMRPRMEEFHSALVDGVEELRAFLERHRDPPEGRPQRVSAQLGAFGAGRIDPDRFSALLAAPLTLEPDELRHAERALSILEAIELKGTDLFLVRVSSGADLHDAVGRRLAEAGRAFGVMRAVAPLVEGRGAALDPSSYTDGMPHRAWTRAERAFAPPLVVDVAGGDLVGSGLGEYIDGGLKLVLVARDRASAAPLARLVSPSVLVIQSSSPQALAQLTTHEGPAVAALGSNGLVSFTHDPGGGEGYGDRISLTGELPDESKLEAIGAVSVFQQREDIAHLRALASLSTAAEVGRVGQTPEASRAQDPIAAWAPPPPAPPDVGLPGHAVPAQAGRERAGDDAVDRLAGWLLQQAGMTAEE